MRAPLRTVGVVLGALAALVALAPSRGDGAPGPPFASYRDSVGEHADAPDIARVVISERRVGPELMRIIILHEPHLSSDVGLEIAFDADEVAMTGDPTLRAGMGVDYLVTVLGGRPRAFSMSRAGVWRSAAAPAFRYARGVATVVLRSRRLARPEGFRFAVSLISGMQPQPDGSFDITDARFDLAPDAGWAPWSYRRASL